MRISDWSSDGCSSDLRGQCLRIEHLDADVRRDPALPREKGLALLATEAGRRKRSGGHVPRPFMIAQRERRDRGDMDAVKLARIFVAKLGGGEIGRASCRERVCKAV